MEGANTWSCWGTQAKMLGTYGKDPGCSGRPRGSGLCTGSDLLAHPKDG